MGAPSLTTPPDWLTLVMETRIQKLNIPPIKPSAPDLPVGRQQLAWEILSWEDASAGNIEKEMPFVQAMAWAAPAVKDGVAAYQQEDGNTVARIDASPYSAEKLWRWARQQNLSIRAKSAGHARDEWAILLETKVPIWLVTPQGLLAATARKMQTGHACEEGSGLEIVIPGDNQPAIWAILFVPDAKKAASAKVRRIEGRLPKDSYQTGAIGQLEITWPDNYLPQLRVTALRFDWIDNWDDKNRKISGSAWGTYVETPGLLEDSKPGMIRISAAGTPACAPR
jgi:hypothetical protein